METIVSIIAGFFFILKTLYFFDIGETGRKGLKYKRMREGVARTPPNMKYAARGYFFAVFSLIVGALLVRYSPHWFITIWLGFYLSIFVNQCYDRKNYLFAKNGLREYLNRIFFWPVYWLEGDW